MGLRDRAWIRGLMMRPVPYDKDMVKNAPRFRILSANNASKTKRAVGILSLPSEKQWQNASSWEASYDRFASVRSIHWLSFFFFFFFRSGFRIGPWGANWCAATGFAAREGESLLGVP